MKQIKDVEVRIHSIIENLGESGAPEDEPEISIITSEGFLTDEDGELSLSYTEEGEGYRTLCDLRLLSSGAVALSRREAVVCDVLFAEGEECRTVYSVPPYKFDLTVRTKRIRRTLAADGGDLRLIYSMNIGGQDKNVNMKITVSVR